ncbi:MAG: GerMN domain-containing protein [Peptococcaceae bacterium]|nr:GerMN domain-containing protein [Peptococcaceae bacterium]
MKRIAAAIILAALILLSLTACNGDTAPDNPDNPGTRTTSTVPVVLYLPNNNADGFVTKTEMIDGTAESIVALLVTEQSLPAGSTLLSFTISGKNGAADMNTVYGQALSQTGTTGEYLLLGSLVNTLLKFYQLDAVTLTIEGQVLETGHNIYDSPLGFYENQNNAGSSN